MVGLHERERDPVRHSGEEEMKGDESDDRFVFMVSRGR